MSALAILPRLIRLRDAPAYLGMDKNRFNAEVRPYLTEIPIGEQGKAFDRLDLDAWADQYKSRNGRPGAQQKESATWAKEPSPGFSFGAGSGKSTSGSKDTDAFAKALAKARGRRQKPISSAA